MARISESGNKGGVNVMGWFINRWSVGKHLNSSHFDRETPNEAVQQHDFTGHLVCAEGRRRE